ncbi:unnamed protein product [Angiostrongylus costaricensis]|uniref:VWFA domain-containing protein n=1 Tax=Angiostrongylus costaricensis TaxID=334426 RepID=A0A0R3PHK0_ANGCS|nr:unnamed protein product [Angiostrongylus costaricensis]
MHIGRFLFACFACCFFMIGYYIVDLETAYRNIVLFVSFPIYDNSMFDTCPLVLHNHMDPELLKFHHPGYNPKENCTIYEPFTELVDAQVLVKEKAKDYNCQARCILHYNDCNYTEGTWINLPSSNLFECDIIETSCSQNETIEAFLHTQIYERKGARSTFPQSIDEDSHNISRPDVFIFIIDSTSSFMAKRSLPKTLKYLKSIGGVQMEFLNKTMVAQDDSAGFAYYPNCMGFNKTEANHVWRSFDLRRRSSLNLKKSFDDACSERHLEMMDYLEKFMKSYPDADLHVLFVAADRIKFHVIALKETKFKKTDISRLNSKGPCHHWRKGAVTKCRRQTLCRPPDHCPSRQLIRDPPRIALLHLELTRHKKITIINCYSLTGVADDYELSALY